MVKDKEVIKKAFNRFVTQQAREQECHDDEIIDIIHEHILDIIASGSSV